MSSRLFFEKSYEGWESLQDWDRDMSEAIQEDFNPEVEKIPNEFPGTIKVMMWYEPTREEKNAEFAEKWKDPKIKVIYHDSTSKDDDRSHFSRRMQDGGW